MWELLVPESPKRDSSVLHICAASPSRVSGNANIHYIANQDLSAALWSSNLHVSASSVLCQDAPNSIPPICQFAHHIKECSDTSTLLPIPLGEQSANRGGSGISDFISDPYRTSHPAGVGSQRAHESEDLMQLPQNSAPYLMAIQA